MTGTDRSDLANGPTGDNAVDATEGTWSPQERVVAAALASGHTHAEAGSLIGRSAKTVQRYMRNPEFRELVSRERSAQMRVITGRLSGLAGRALEVVAAVLDDDTFPIRVRLEAARYAINQSHLQHRSLLMEEELADRLDRLERLLDRQERPETREVGDE